LNNTVNKLFEIDEKRLNIFEGNYDDYIEGKSEWLALREKTLVLQEKKRKRLEELIKHVHKIKDGKKRGSALKAARTRMRREVLRNEIEKYQEKAIRNFHLKGSLHHKKKIVEVQNVTFGYQRNRTIIKKADLALYGKERVWFLGKNGIGKTTFINLIIGRLTPRSGKISWGENIKYTYFSQDQRHLDMEATVEEFFIKNTGIPYENSFGVLERFLFPKDLRHYKLKTLSPGQRARLSFAIFAQHDYNFLILDEPTNHLDIKTKEVIEESLRNFEGAILVISHDRYFVRSGEINRIITLENKKIVELNDFVE
jgi:ATP-binding cassette subfamily F protein 3